MKTRLLSKEFIKHCSHKMMKFYLKGKLEYAKRFPNKKQKL